MRIKFVVPAFLAFLAVYVFGQSQPPAPGPTKTAQTDKQEKGSKNKKADEAAPIINSRPTPSIAPITAVDKNEEADHSNQSADNSPSNWWLIIPTIVIAMATIVQAWIYWGQAGIMREALEQTKNAAEAAKSSADTASRQAGIMEDQAKDTKAASKAAIDSATAAILAAQNLINSERAWVLPERIRATRFGPPGSGTDNTFVFDLVNRGKTVARLTGPFRMRFHLIPDTQMLPPTPDYGVSGRLEETGRKIVHGQVLSPGDKVEDIVAPCFDPRITADVIEKIEEFSHHLFFYASIKYFDFAEKERELQFCYMYHPTGYGNRSAWLLMGPNEYNKHT